MKRGFTLIEMLIVIGIIAILSAVSAFSYGKVIERTQTAKLQELVHEVQTGLVQILQKDDSWPHALLTEAASGNGQLKPEIGGILAKRGVISLSYEATSRDGTTYYKLTGLNKFGILTPWAEDVVRRLVKGGKLSESTKVPTGGTIESHRLRFAVDSDYSGKVVISGEGGISCTVRANACVWSAGKDGVFGTKDDVKSWAKGQEVR